MSHDPTKCMREFCEAPRWHHPEQGELVLCQPHAEEVFRGERKAPPLRRSLDYTSVGRKTFLVFDPPEREPTVKPEDIVWPKNDSES